MEEEKKTKMNRKYLKISSPKNRTKLIDEYDFRRSVRGFSLDQQHPLKMRFIVILPSQFKLNLIN